MRKIIKNKNLVPVTIADLNLDDSPDLNSTDPVTSRGIATAITEAVGGASDALQEQIDDIAEKAGSGYIPKGPASVATLNGLTGQENGWLYTMTDAGTLTDGSVAVVAGDSVAWDATNEVWYKAMDYATKKELQDIDEKKLNGSLGKNLFNKSTTNVRTNAFVNYTNGLVVPSTGTNSYVVTIPEGITEVSINKSALNLSAYSSISDITNKADYSTVRGYLGGVVTSTNSSYTLPAGTKCLIVSATSSVANTLQIESGTSVTAYEPYNFGLPWKKIVFNPIKELHVGAGFDYGTIQEAVDAATSGYTIIVHPGTYEESVNVYYSGKNLVIKGTSKRECILKYKTGNYYYPPLAISKGRVENLTIKATGTTLDEGAERYAYCVHIDYDNESNSTLEFVNCDFENDRFLCVGIGLRENFHLTFYNCHFVTHYQGATPIFCHEQQASNKLNQKLSLINCTAYNDNTNATSYAVTLQESADYTGNEMTIEMQRCIFKAKGGFPNGRALRIDVLGEGTGGEGSGGDGYLGSQGWFLDYGSELNNEAICNQSEQ